MTHIIQDLFSFLSAAPTPWHSCTEIANRLSLYDFEEIDEKKPLNLKPLGKYFIKRGGSLLTFVMPEKKPLSALIGAAHTDSPSLKIKPHPEFQEENMHLFRLESYGGPLLSTWYDRDLAIAGQVCGLDQKENYQTQLLHIDDSPLVIPSLAIHLSEKKEGLIKQYLDKQEHLCPLVSLSSNQEPVLIPLLQEYSSLKKIYSHDLFLVPIQSPAFLGLKQELIASYRLDNLCSVHSILCGLLSSLDKAHAHTLKMAIFWNHEEVGSKTDEGAASPFFEDILQRICLKTHGDLESYYTVKNRSICLSLDVSHAFHPNFKKRYDPQDHPLFEKGTIIKLASSMRYSSNAETAAFVAKICDQHNLLYQLSSSHSEIACGSTIGPVFSSTTGIPTVDLGSPLLAMHSARELISVQDHLNTTKLMKFSYMHGF